MKKTIFVLLLLALLGLNLTAAQDDTLVVDASSAEGTINPYVYGASYGPWALVSPEMTPLAAESGITFLRFPGGNWGDQNDLTPFQIDLFILQARAWGAEPSISTRFTGGSPEQSAALVHYTNIEKDYDVRYWSIGNEPTLYSDEGYDIDSFNAVWRQHAEAMLAVDPDIILIGPEVHQYPGSENAPDYLNQMRVWVREFLKVNGDLVDIVSIHRYPFPVNPTTPPTIDALRNHTPETSVMIDLVRADIQEAIGRDLPIAVTEINSNYTNSTGGPASPDSFYNAIWWADVLGRLIESKVDVVSYFALASSAGSGLGLLERYDPRPTYYVYQLYQQFGSELVSTTSPDNDVTIYAAKRDDGALTLIVINLSPDQQTRSLSLTGFTPEAQADVWLFDAEHNAEQIDSIELVDGSTIALPGQSITLFVLPGSASD